MHHVTETCVGVEVKLHAFLTSAWRPQPHKHIRWTGDWVSPKASGKGKTCRESNTGHQAPKPSHYTDRATLRTLTRVT